MQLPADIENLIYSLKVSLCVHEINQEIMGLRLECQSVRNSGAIPETYSQVTWDGLNANRSWFCLYCGSQTDSFTHCYCQKWRSWNYL